MKKTRKNLFTYSLNPLFPKKKGFTLAEVLIVIGIIGVVAALTIPTLIKNHQKRVWVEQLRTSVVKIQDGFRLAMAEDGVDDLGETELWSTLAPTCDTNYDTNYNELKRFTDRLGQYLKIGLVQKSSDFKYQIKYLNTRTEEPLEGEGTITLLNGAMITTFYFYGTRVIPTNDNARLNGGAMWKKCGEFWIDVNGPKGPNQFGRDIFGFDLAQNGLLYPYGGKDFAIYEGNATLENYKTNEGYWNQNGTNSGIASCNTKIESVGFGCAARIIEEGWKMNY